MPNLSVCDGCDELADRLTGAILNSIYGHYCDNCVGTNKRKAHTGKASYDRDRDREDYKKDMLQPFLPDGTPNTEFIRAYPERKANFTDDELKEYG